MKDKQLSDGGAAFLLKQEGCHGKQRCRGSGEAAAGEDSQHTREQLTDVFADERLRALPEM